MSHGNIPNLLHDLGKPTRRGVRKCHRCGTVTGTRGKSCKNPACDVIFKDTEHTDIKKTFGDEGACRVALRSENDRIFSVRTYHRGPDYRTFVQLPSQPGLGISSPTSKSKCYSVGCNKTHHCGHIKVAERCSRNSEKINLKESVLDTVAVPDEVKAVLSSTVFHTPDILVQRCSSQVFVINCGSPDLQPFGLCHMLFFKVTKDELGRAEQRFVCSCQPAKFMRRSSSSQEASAYENSTKYCIHYYACVCAFASNDQLAAEFRCFLTQALEGCPGTNLNNNIASASTPASAPESVQDPPTICVTIMRDNLSLLESISAVDDHDSSEVHSSQCALSEHTVINSTDDALSFGDSSTLDSLDENDTTHLTHISQILTATTLNEHDEEPCKIRSRGQVDDVEDTLSTGSPPSSHTHKKIRIELTGALDASSPILVSPNNNNADGAEIEKKMLLKSFDRWLGSINERMNASMNSQLSETCSVIDYVTQEIFDCLKDRLVASKRKSQSVLITRKDRPPLGTFRKYAWNVISITQLVNIFQSAEVPVKLSQFFVQTSNGLFVEWERSNCQEKKHKQLLPVVHCTKLKVGKLDSKDKDVKPFVIEWIPDILPTSSMGELTLSFKVSHTGPIQTEEERRAVNASTHRLIQSPKV